jgi:FixJ family two-component response regulator
MSIGLWGNSTADGLASILGRMPRPLRNVAIIDDDPAVLKALARLLRTHAFTVATFQSGQQFLASLPEPLPDCLILDLQMPGMTGLEIQQDLAHRGIRIPTIIITAHDEAGTRERCTSAGAIAYLAKPVPQAALFAAIEAAGSVGAR